MLEGVPMAGLGGAVYKRAVAAAANARAEARAKGATEREVSNAAHEAVAALAFAVWSERGEVSLLFARMRRQQRRRVVRASAAFFPTPEIRRPSLSRTSFSLDLLTRHLSTPHKPQVGKAVGDVCRLRSAALLLSDRRSSASEGRKNRGGGRAPPPRPLAPPPVLNLSRALTPFAPSLSLPPQLSSQPIPSAGLKAGGFKCLVGAGRNRRRVAAFEPLSPFRPSIGGERRTKKQGECAPPPPNLSRALTPETAKTRQARRSGRRSPSSTGFAVLGQVALRSTTPHASTRSTSEFSVDYRRRQQPMPSVPPLTRPRHTPLLQNASQLGGALQGEARELLSGLLGRSAVRWVWGAKGAVWPRVRALPPRRREHGRRAHGPRGSGTGAGG